jgi:hypothetical protein
VKGFVGEVEHTNHRYSDHDHNETYVYLFTHLDFAIAYNGSNVIPSSITIFSSFTGSLFHLTLLRSLIVSYERHDVDHSM